MFDEAEGGFDSFSEDAEEYGKASDDGWDLDDELSVEDLEEGHGADAR